MRRQESPERYLSFWTMQTGGWLLYAAAIVTSNLPLRHERSVVAFRTAFLGSAFLASFLLYAVCRTVWHRRANLVTALACCVSTVAALGFACAAISLWSEIRFGGLHEPFRWTSAFSGMTGASFVLIAWSTIYFGIKQYQVLQEERRRLRASEATAREAQLRALRYQLQPHFLFNTLNAISSLVVSGQTQRATSMISRLADLLRNTLDDPDVHFVPFADELVLVREYLAIEEVRFESRLRIQFDLAPDTLAVPVPRFFMQPLIENAIRHGISHLPEGGALVIRAQLLKDRLEVQIENDIPQLSPETPHSGVGVGLHNTRMRMEQIYGVQGAVATSRQRQGRFSVAITLPAVLPDATARVNAGSLA